MDILHSQRRYRNRATVRISEQEDQYRTIYEHQALVERQRSIYCYSTDIALPAQVSQYSRRYRTATEVISHHIKDIVLLTDMEAQQC